MEYNAITHHADPVYASNKKHFKAEEDPLPDYLLPYFKRVIRITRLREVRVLLGFTRVDAPDPDADEQTNIVYLNKGKTEKWLPAAEVHGEGVFIEFNRDSIDAWLRDPELGALSQKYAQCYKEFCESKEWTVTTLRDARYVLMHTFAHLLIKQMSMSSGYSSSAIRERIYFGDDMSGVLLYTGSADKEGSLGGLVELGNIDQLIVLMKDAFQEALVCTNDPECLNNVPAGNNSNGAACHSCCMISETASGSVCGIEIYACLRDESGYQTKKIRATDKLLSSTKDKVAGFINCTYLADDAEFDTSENIADNKKEFYEISLIENYRPFTFLDDAEKRTEYYSESDRNKLSGFLFRINLNDKYFWVYQHIYSVSRIDRSKNIIALFVGDTYDEIDSDIVQIDSRADVIIFSSSVVTAKMDLMQRFFGFEQYIRAGAQKTIEIIRDLDIVDSLEKFVAFENKSKLTNAKKLLKAKNSPVLQMKKNDLLENLKKHSRYKTMFKFEEDHIVISSQKEAAAFIKMLNDDIVRSELTGKEYDSSSKMLLGPVGASH